MTIAGHSDCKGILDAFAIAVVKEKWPWSKRSRTWNLPRIICSGRFCGALAPVLLTAEADAMVRGMTRRGTSTAMMSRATPILGLFFVVVAQLSAFLHLAAIPHELCREHGELVEGGAVDGEANQDRPDDVPVDGDHRHDHCPQLTHPPQALQAQPLLVLLPGSALVHAPGGMPASAPAPVEPLSFAPKTSPPARLI